MATNDRLIELFHEAKALPAGEERNAFLAEACGEDAQLRKRICGLLQADEAADDFLLAGLQVSSELEAELVRGITESGINVLRIGVGASPMLYFAVATLGVQGGIQVTGSHNPSDYNGFKMLLNGRSVFGEEIQKLGRRAADGDWSDGHGHVEQVDILDAYVDRLVQGFQGGSFRVGWDAGNGAAGPALEKLIAKLVPQLAPYQRTKLVVNGYTDNAPISKELQHRGITSNAVLSQKRAEAVMAYLTAYGVKRSSGGTVT